jgi:hypothetical protein
MTCRCGYQFCYRCGKPTMQDCNCPYADDGPTLIAGQLEILAPILGEADRRGAAARAMQRAARARLLRSGKVDSKLAAALLLQDAARCARGGAGVSVSEMPAAEERLTAPAPTDVDAAQTSEDALRSEPRTLVRIASSPGIMLDELEPPRLRRARSSPDTVGLLAPPEL